MPITRHIFVYIQSPPNNLMRSRSSSYSGVCILVNEIGSPSLIRIELESPAHARYKCLSSSITQTKAVVPAFTV